MYRIKKRVIHTGRIEIIAESTRIADIRKTWSIYLSRWPLYYDIKVYPDELKPDTRYTIATSHISIITMEIDSNEQG